MEPGIKVNYCEKHKCSYTNNCAYCGEEEINRWADSPACSDLKDK